MNRMKIIVGALTGAAIALPLAFAVVSAEAANTPQYQDGDCKWRFQTTMGVNEPTAKAAWEAMVAGKFGTKWAHWVGAKNKVIIPIPLAGGGFVYQAKAKPCFYNPVQ
jgi:hypothetical protein